MGFDTLFSVIGFSGWVKPLGKLGSNYFFPQPSGVPAGLEQLEQDALTVRVFMPEIAAIKLGWLGWYPKKWEGLCN